MSNRGSRTGWMITISALVLVAWMVGASTVAWRGLGRNRSKISNRLARAITGRGQHANDSKPSYNGPLTLSDPRLNSLRLATDSWQRSVGPRRVVVDQVCLVPDVAAFLEAIALWDDRYFFPILIDEPAWTLPFLRAFRPARVIRFAGTTKPGGPDAFTGSSTGPADSDGLWSQALDAVARAWSGPAQSEFTQPDADRPPRGLGATPPGLVLAGPKSPMLAGAVALAGGRFQPLVRLEAPGEAPSFVGDPVSPERSGDVLSLKQALRFMRRVELRVASVIPQYDQLGDDCDFVTIAGDWPYRYSYDLGPAPIRGIYALDDLIGRVFDASVQGGWIHQTRRRWAYTGRLVGEPAASVARAMGALFLQPKSALLWNTYSGGRPWSDYTLKPAADDLRRAIEDVGAVVHRSGHEAGLANWHRAVDPVNRFAMVLFDSYGGPDWFSISGGAGRPSDIPRGLPAAVAMIHSFSAADLNDPQTIAARWLSQGAYIYFGSVNEPFLLAFRPPRLVAALLAADVPFVAALRQGELEPFGFPWRLIYLGDPLYRLQNAAVTPDRPGTQGALQAATNGRVSAGNWRGIASDYESWPVTEITAPMALSIESARGRVFDSEDDRFRSCLDASISELAELPSAGSTRTTGASLHAQSSTFKADDWREVLREIRRDWLDRGLWTFYDELLIDALLEVGAVDELMARLARILPAERGPRVWEAMETCAMQRLARMSDGRGESGSFVRVLDLWDEVIRLNWPASSHFPAHFSERVGTLALADARRSRPWLDRLRNADLALAALNKRYPHAAVIATEQARIKAQLGGLGSSR